MIHSWGALGWVTGLFQLIQVLRPVCGISVWDCWVLVVEVKGLEGNVVNWSMAAASTLPLQALPPAGCWLCLCGLARER